jgi:O-6-methylguanine DNA methyltransferase
MKLYYSEFEAAGAMYYIASTEKGLAFVGSPDRAIVELKQFYRGADFAEDNLLNVKAARQIREYLEGRREEFDLPVDTSKGTPFQQKIWNTLKKIPYGTAIDYAGLAKLAGEPEAIRATSNAVARNPILFVLPCHRVILKNGGIGKYRAGSELKEKLLKMEGFIKD